MRELILTRTSIQAASVVLHISLPATLDSLICSQVRHSWRSCSILHALPQWIISLHVFEDDTVAKVTVSKANLNAFFGFVGPCPVPCCFAVLLCGETQIWLGDLRVVFGCGGFLFVVVFVMICLSFWTTRVLVHSCFSLLTQL